MPQAMAQALTIPLQVPLKRSHGRQACTQAPTTSFQVGPQKANCLKPWLLKPTQALATPFQVGPDGACPGVSTLLELHF